MWQDNRNKCLQHRLAFKKHHSWLVGACWWTITWLGKSDDKLDSLEKKTFDVTTACELCCQLNLSVDEGFRM